MPPEFGPKSLRKMTRLSKFINFKPNMAIVDHLQTFQNRVLYLIYNRVLKWTLKEAKRSFY